MILEGVEANEVESEVMANFWDITGEYYRKNGKHREALL